MEALIKRLQEAEAGSRELDHEIAEFFGWKLVLPHKFWRAPVGWKPLSAIEGLPNFTTSLDAIVALIGEKLPGWRIQLTVQTGVGLCRIMDREQMFEGYAKSGPLALCIALLTALQQRSES